MAPNSARMMWRAGVAALAVLPAVLLLNALFMLRELGQARGAFLRNKAAEIAGRLEQVPAEQLMEEEPALRDLRSFGAGDAERDASLRPLLEGRELFRLEDDGARRFRAWVPYHSASGARVARMDLNPAAADFLTSRPARNLYLSIAVVMVMAALTGYVLYARQKQEQLARLAELGQMSAVLAHEIRNPLGALKGFLQLAQEQSSGEARQWLETSLDQTNRLEALVKDLLLCARAPQPKMRTVEWSEMESRLKPHAPAATFAPAAFRFTTDPDLLERTVLNLLRNALEAGTEVNVEAEPGRIRVTDDGPGLPREVRARLFHPFVTTKAQGTGLGLAIVRNLTAALGAEIVLTDARPAGTCAEIRWKV
jgi:signal transduction histidine kinase